MAEVKLVKHVQAPPDKVFRIASDFAEAAERIEGIQRVELLTPGPVRLGTRFRETRLMFGREATEEMEVTAFDPPHSYTLGCESHGCRYAAEFRFTASGTGTEVAMEFKATPLTFLAKAMAVAMAPMIRQVADVCAKDLDDLKRAVESA
jgi:carbon monoxide dehydrogenase subunit G